MTTRAASTRLASLKQQVTAEPEGLRRSPRNLPHQLKEGSEEPRPEREPDIEALPRIVFTKRIRYASDFFECAQICDDLIQEVTGSREEFVPVGFDLEWPFSFQTGSGRTALAQICLQEEVCYLLHIHALRKLPASLVQLLCHPRVKLVGVNVKNDVWKLGRDFPEFPAQRVVENNCCDCGTYANRVLKRSCRWSLARLTGYLLRKRVSKDPEVRMSKWHVLPLSEAQKIYAATDAYVSLLLYTTIANLDKQHISSPTQRCAQSLHRMHRRTVKVLVAGRLPYGVGLRLQKTLADRHHAEHRPDESANTLVVLQHEPVYTVGIRNRGYTKADEKKLRSLGADFWRTDRGGLITFHGPGQLVAYPVLDLKQFRASVRWYVQQVERMVIRVCAELGIKAETSPDTGVWVGDSKICAIGVHGSRYVTTHGLALNCNTDLGWFEHIVPCGIEGKGVTSISRELDMDVTVDDVLPIFRNAFGDQFQCELTEFPPGEASQLLRDARRDVLQET